MSLDLNKLNALEALAGLMSTFLPASGADTWRNHQTFGTIAKELGIETLWEQSAGNKRQRLHGLFEKTLRTRPELFERLIQGIFSRGLTYRKRQGQPITTEELRQIRGHILTLGFRFPWLTVTEDFDVEDAARARRTVDEERRQLEMAREENTKALRKLAELESELMALHSMTDRRAAGFKLERLLNDLFKLSGLDPRGPFKIVGEQIDGSFVLDGEIYLLEAKWEVNPLPEADLLVFHGKIEGKGARGVFIAMNNVSNEAAQAIVTGKVPQFFVMDGHDLVMILKGVMTLKEFLRERWRSLKEDTSTVRFTFPALQERIRQRKGDR